MNTWMENWTLLAVVTATSLFFGSLATVTYAATTYATSTAEKKHHDD